MDKVAQILANGGVALLPTDTVYGLLASPSHPKAIAEIFRLKGRPEKKNLPILVADIEQIIGLGVVIDDHAHAILASRFIPGALTLVLPLPSERAPAWLKGRTEIAVRIPNDAKLRALLHQTGPLLATSANASGQEPPAKIAPILAQLNGTPEIVVDDGPRGNQASTLIDCQSTPYTVIRHGALSRGEIEEILAL